MIIDEYSTEIINSIIMEDTNDKYIKLESVMYPSWITGVKTTYAIHVYVMENNHGVFINKNINASLDIMFKEYTDLVSKYNEVYKFFETLGYTEVKTIPNEHGLHQII